MNKQHCYHNVINMHKFRKDAVVTKTAKHRRRFPICIVTSYVAVLGTHTEVNRRRLVF
jgi:hypothetical protein